MKKKYPLYASSSVLKIELDLSVVIESACDRIKQEGVRSVGQHYLALNAWSLEPPDVWMNRTMFRRNVIDSVRLFKIWIRQDSPIVRTEYSY